MTMLNAPAEACARNEKFEKQLELAGPSMSSMVSQVRDDAICDYPNISDAPLMHPRSTTTQFTLVCELKE